MSQIEQIVLLIHGIRTQADWQPMVVKTLEEQDKIRVIPIKYGYFDVFRFWSPFTRQKPIDRIEKLLRVVRKKYPHAKISVIAHSFGSYIIGNLLEKQIDLELDKLILCGSVLPSSYEWEKVIHKFIDGNNENVINIINESGKQDIWPVLAKSMSWGYGPSGTHGFGHVLVKDRFHNTDHGGYFNQNFVATYWKPFIEKGEYILGEEAILPFPWRLSILELLPLRWLLVAGIVCIFYILALVTVVSQEGCSKVYDPSDYRPGKLKWDGHVGNVKFVNVFNQPVTVTLYHPNAPSWSFKTWEVPAKQSIILDYEGQPITVGMDWGIKLGSWGNQEICILKKVSTWHEEERYFEVSQKLF